MALEDYRHKRSFARSPEPAGASGPAANHWRFVVQKHASTRLHYDLRLELNGVLLSWAIPKGPSLDTTEKRLAVHVEDHPLEYLEFEGVIPKHEYGGGTMMVWDTGYWTPRDHAQNDYAKGELKFDLFGQKLSGGFMLKRMGRRGDENQWLLIKERDAATRPESEFNVLTELPDSVLTGRTLDQIAAASPSTASLPPTEQEARTKGSHDADGHESRPPSPQRNPTDRKANSTPFRFDAAKHPKAQKKSPPKSIRPCLPTTSRQAPIGEQWVHEIKFDGYRMVCHLKNGSAVFYSRNGRNWTDRLQTLSKAVGALPCKSAVLDGEVVMMGADGVTSFQSLQNRIGAGRDGELRYYLFDLLYLDGYDLTALNLLERKNILADLIADHGDPDRILFSEHLVGDGPTIFAQACKLGVEGIVSKRIDKRYSQGRYEFWLKTKCVQSREFLIGGFTPSTASTRGLGAILLGVPCEDDKLHFVGKIGTGFSHDTLISLRQQLDAIRTKKSPFDNLSRRRADKGTIWVEPQLVAEIEFAGWTGDGQIRFGSFRGLREDIDRDELDFSMPPSDGSTGLAQDESLAAAEDVSVDPSLVELPPDLASIKLTSPDRVVYPDMGITKLGVATYYAQVGKWMLPQIAGRPISLLRCPGGVNEPCFFQKRAPQGLHRSVQRVELVTTEGPKMYLVVDDLVGLLALVQFGVLEFHVSGARADKFERPDRLVIDLDPDEKLPWSHTTSAAKDIRQWLAEAGLVSFVKTTGGKGLHVVVPIRRRHSWQDVKNFTHQVAVNFAGRSPERFTTNPAKIARKNKILIDTLRNTRGATAVAAYSTRARPNASVSVPISWDELDAVASSDSMSLRSVIARLAEQTTDPWAELDQVEQSVTKKAWKLLS